MVSLLFLFASMSIFPISSIFGSVTYDLADDAVPLVFTAVGVLSFYEALGYLIFLGGCTTFLGIAVSMTVVFYFWYVGVLFP